MAYTSILSITIHLPFGLLVQPVTVPSHVELEPVLLSGHHLHLLGVPNIGKYDLLKDTCLQQPIDQVISIFVIYIYSSEFVGEYHQVAQIVGDV